MGPQGVTTFGTLWSKAEDGGVERTPVATRVGICTALTALFTTVQLRFSIDRARLSVVPQYDDIVYHLQGIERLKHLREGGVLGLLANFRDQPLWSPWGGIVSTTGYAIFGVRPWALYAMNAILVFALLWFVDRLTVGASLWKRIGCWLLVLSTQLAAHTVTEFRPDIACAIPTAAAIFAILRIDAGSGGRRTATVAGLCAATAFLIKPTVFAATTTFIGFAGIVMVGRELVRCRMSERASVRTLVSKIARCGVVTVVLVAPHFSWQAYKAAKGGGVNYLQYFYEHIFGTSSAIWDKHLHGWDNFAYFLDGPSGQLMFGRSVIPLFIIAALGTASAFVRREKTLALFLAQSWIVAGFTLLMPAMNKVKNPHFGDVFGVIVLMIAAISMRHLLTPPARAIAPLMRRATLAVSLGLLVSMLTLADYARQTPGSLNATSRPAFDPRATEAMLDKVADAMIEAREIAEESKRQRGERGPFRVFFPTSGYVNKDTAAYTIARKGYPLWSIDHGHKVGDKAFHAEQIAHAHVVVAYEPGVADEHGMDLIHEVFPSTKFVQETVDMAGNDAGLLLVARVPSPAGPAICVFARTGPSSIDIESYREPAAGEAAAGEAATPEADSVDGG